MRQPPLGIQRRHAAAGGRGDGLAIIIVGHVAGCEHAFHASRGSLRLGPANVLLVGQFQFPLLEGRVGRMPDAEKQSAYFEMIRSLSALLTPRGKRPETAV